MATGRDPSWCSGEAPKRSRRPSLTYDVERDAPAAKEFIEAAGGYAAEAARIAEGARREATWPGGCAR